MKLYKIKSIVKKQVKDTLKNKSVLIQFVMLPVLTVVMVNSINIEDMPRNYFVLLFASMFIGMAPLTCMSAIIAEEKEKNTLRVLMMSNVSPGEYLLGTGGYIFFICMIGALVFGLVGGYQGLELLAFTGIMGMGIIISILIGAAIGVWSENEMSATSRTVPVMMVFSFLPMLSMFNENIQKVSRITYSQQIHDLMNSVGNMTVNGEHILVITMNLIIVLALFVFAYRRCGLA